jgi:hypothetical protein
MSALPVRTMKSADEIKALIAAAFEDARYPGDSRIVDSDQGSEPERVERDFKGKTDWRRLEPSFIDQSPDELATALSFFSDEALVFYLPAYLCADLDGRLSMANPVFKLTHDFSRAVGDEKIGGHDSGDRTWRDYGERRFSGFTAPQAEAIVAYLEFKLERAGPYDNKEEIIQALDSYWRRRAAP